MSKYKIQKKDNMIIPLIRISKKDIISLDANFKDFENEMFLKAYSVKTNRVIYQGVVAESLYEMLTKTIKKRDFLIIIESLIVAVSTVLDNGCSLNRLLLDLKTVFYNKNKQQVYFILLPFEKNKSKNDVYGLLSSFVKKYKPAIENDTDYIVRFRNLLEQLQGYDLHRLENFVMQEDRDIVEQIRRSFGIIDDLKGHHLPKAEAAKSSVDSDSQETAFAPVNNESSKVAVVAKNSDEEETAFAGDEETQLATVDNTSDFEKTVFAPTNSLLECHLIKYSTGESIPINKLVFRLGRTRDCVDYCILDETISGVHMDIICRDNQVYVMDLGSKNKSYVNDKELPEKVETLIYDGDVIRLANEMFIFCTGK